MNALHVQLMYIANTLSVLCSTEFCGATGRSVTLGVTVTKSGSEYLLARLGFMHTFQLQEVRATF
jgi:hypothetical protein